MEEARVLKERKVTKRGRNLFNIQQIIKKIKMQNENAKITFFHRYIYQENDPRILIAIYKRIKNKLIHMMILSKIDNEYNEENLKNAIEQYDNNNELFYVNKNK